MDIILTALAGAISSVLSAWLSWFFARKKYNSEVDNNLIENMQESLTFYQKLSDDNKNRLDEVLKRNAELEEEVRELRKQVTAMISMICSDTTCKHRITNRLED